MQSPTKSEPPSPTSLKSKLHRTIQSIAWLRWLFVTKDGQIVIAQMPNAPLVVALVAAGVGYIAHGQVKSVSTLVAEIGFVIWSIMEIGWGVNPFRRILGAVVFVLVGVAMFRRLG